MQALVYHGPGERSRESVPTTSSAGAAATHPLKVVLHAVPVGQDRSEGFSTKHSQLTDPHARGDDMITYENIAEWRGKTLVDRDGDKIGKLEDVYVHVETDEPIFGTVKEGHIGRHHLTFVPLGGITIGPESLQVPVSSDQVEEAPDIALDGDELSQQDESNLYHHYQLNYTPPETQSGRRLARR